MAGKGTGGTQFPSRSFGGRSGRNRTPTLAFVFGEESGSAGALHNRPDLPKTEPIQLFTSLSQSLSLAKFYTPFRSSLVTTCVKHLPLSLQISVNCAFSMLLCPLSHMPPADGTESSIFSLLVEGRDFAHLVHC